WQKHLAFRTDAAKLRVRAVKVFADGGFSACNAATRRPYVREHAHRPGSKGRINLGRRRLAAALQRCSAAGLQLAVHAHGERAQEAVCAAVGLAGLPEDESLRTRLEHAGNFVTDEATVAAWREAQIVPLAQPVFLYNFFGDFLPIYLGDHARHGRYPLRTLL